MHLQLQANWEAMVFVKGQSGNPKGRIKKSAELLEVEALAKTMAVPALMRLSYWVGCDDPRASITASIAILNRAYGAPKQAFSGDLTITTTTQILDDMRERARTLRNEPEPPHLIEQRDAA
jgi:hypothetical protein